MGLGTDALLVGTAIDHQPVLQIEDAGYKTLPVATPEVRKRVTGIRPLRDNSFEVFQNKFREAFRPAAASTKITLNDIPLGVQPLNGKEQINLDGLFTVFDFDTATTSAKVTWTTWCVGDTGQYISGSRIFQNGNFGPPALCE